MVSPDSWLEIVVRLPVLLVPVLVLVAGGFSAGGVLVFKRVRARIRMLSSEVESLHSRSAAHAEHEARWVSASETYRRFIHTVSHEVSNPLQSIQTNLDNMASCPPGETQRWMQSHAIAMAEVRRLARLIDNMRMLSRLETPEFPTIREPVNLTAVVEDVIMALYETAEARQVQLQYVGPRHPAHVLGDRDGLRQVLTNLIDNGIKYSRDDGGKVIIGVQEDKDRLRVRISDEGIGIAAEDLPHIFDTAYRAIDARSLRQRGSGLGLTIARRIVKEHGGEIEVRSQPGEGTTVSFDLPLYSPSR